MTISPADERPTEAELVLSAEDTTPTDEPATLRQRVVRGGFFLAVREGVGVVAGVVGGVLLARLIGPSDFGLYVALIAVFVYLQNLATMGINAYLVRTPGPLNRRTLDEASTMLVLLSLAATALAELALPLLSHFAHLDRLGTLGRLTLLALPLVVVAQVPLAKLEHDLEFRTVAWIEGLAQVLLYAVALPLAAYSGLGVGAGIAGWLSQQLFLAVALTLAAHYRPRPALSRSGSREMLAYGASFSSSIWVWQLRTLINPILVGRYAGADAVGLVGLAIRLVENLSFVKTATWRLSIAALAQVQQRRDKLVTSIEDGMSLQLLALGPFVVVFVCLGTVALRLAFGDDWLPALVVFPYVAVSYMTNATFNIHSSALYVIRRNWDVTKFHLVHIALFVVGAVAFVPAYGARGYGFAELLALPGYWVVHRAVVKSIGTVRYMNALVLLAGFSVAVFARELGWWTLFALVPMLAWPGTRGDLVRYVRMLRGAR